MVPETTVLARPPKEIKGFTKVLLDLGKTAEVSIDLGRRAFAYYDPGDPTWVERSTRVPGVVGGGHYGPGHRDQPGWYADPGSYRLLLGASVSDIRTGTLLRLEK